MKKIDSASSRNNSNLFANLGELDYSPPREDYRIGPSDLLVIKVFQADELSQETRVTPQGFVTLPLLGAIPAAGLTQGGFENQLKARLGAKYLQNPQVTVFIKEKTAQRVTVEGEVNRPGVFPIEGSMTVLQAIASANGLSNLASPSRTVLFRPYGNSVRAYNINIDDIRSGQARDPYIKNDDRIVVHRSDSRYWLREVGTLLSPVRTILSF